jgi:hypothetical protein
MVQMSGGGLSTADSQPLHKSASKPKKKEHVNNLLQKNITTYHIILTLAKFEKSEY